MKTPIHHEMGRMVDEVRCYLKARLERQAISALNESIRNLRIVVQQLLTDHFLALPLPKAKEFRFALADQLSSVCSELRNHDGCQPEDEEHHRYCIREVLVCFEWAEQIKEEVPDDPITQKILAVDIPILRPFDYGVGKTRSFRKK